MQFHIIKLLLHNVWSEERRFYSPWISSTYKINFIIFGGFINFEVLRFWYINFNSKVFEIQHFFSTYFCNSSSRFLLLRFRRNLLPWNLVSLNFVGVIYVHRNMVFYNIWVSSTYIIDFYYFWRALAIDTKFQYCIDDEKW